MKSNIFLRFFGVFTYSKMVLGLPDIFQYALDHFWNFPKSANSRPVPPFFLCRICQNIYKKMWTSLKHTILAYPNISKIQSFKNVGNGRTSQVRKQVYYLCSISGGPKTIGFSKRSQTTKTECRDGGILINYGKSENMKT